MKADKIKGQTVICMASGPSLTKEDCLKVKASGFLSVAINSTCLEFASFSDFVYAGDNAWWINYFDKVNPEAELWTCSRNAKDRFRINLHNKGSSQNWNSGLRAIEFCIEKGASKIILLGYDSSLIGGVHCHGLHVGEAQHLNNPTQSDIERWHKHFKSFTSKNVEIINCSRYTELTCFKRDTLEKALKC